MHSHARVPIAPPTQPAEPLVPPGWWCFPRTGSIFPPLHHAQTSAHRAPGSPAAARPARTHHSLRRRAARDAAGRSGAGPGRVWPRPQAGRTAPGCGRGMTGGERRGFVWGRGRVLSALCPFLSLPCALNNKKRRHCCPELWVLHPRRCPRPLMCPGQLSWEQPAAGW